jgi:hypothetical protein
LDALLDGIPQPAGRRVKRFIQVEENSRVVHGLLL